jgi:predicted MFS family arabinose efflux permease
MARREIADPAVFGWAWPIFGAAAAVSTLVAVRGALHGANRRVWIAAQVVMAAGVALPVVAGGMVTIALAASAVGGTFVVITMVGMQEARRVAGSGAAPLMAAMTAAFGAGQIAGPLCVSAIVAAGGGFAPALLLAALALSLSAWALARSRSGALRAGAAATSP